MNRQEYKIKTIFFIVDTHKIILTLTILFFWHGPNINLIHLLLLLL